MTNTERLKILVVDDADGNVDMLTATLGDDYEVCVAKDGPSAIEMATKSLPNLVLLDVVMEGMDGYEVCHILRSSETTAGIPVVFTASFSDNLDEARGLDLGAVDYITKPFSPALVRARVKNYLELTRHQSHSNKIVGDRDCAVEPVRDVAAECLRSSAKSRDPETDGHIRRISNYLRILALNLRKSARFITFLTDENIELLCKSAPLHDIGNLGIPEEILLKPGKLTPEEFEIMKTHTTLGKQAIAAAERKLGTSSFLRLAGELAESHHERWDGNGYPNGLKGDDIPISGRLMAVADVYDALISKRVYKAPLPHSIAAAIIADDRGKGFDQRVIDAFTECKDEFRKVAIEHADFDEERNALQK